MSKRAYDHSWDVWTDLSDTADRLGCTLDDLKGDTRAVVREALSAAGGRIAAALYVYEERQRRADADMETSHERYEREKNERDEEGEE